MIKIARFFLNFFVFFALVSVPIVQAVLIDTGGGRYYDTATGMYQNADGSIKSSTSDGFSAAMSAGSNQTMVITAEPLGETPTNNCVSGTESILANGSGQCQAYINNKLTTISFCTGNEISGPCRPERIDPIAAATSAFNQSQSTGQSCQAQFVGFPGVDPNTGLSYYYNITCSGGAGSFGGTSTTGGTSGTGSTGYGTSGSGAQSGTTFGYLSSLTSIVNSFITLARNAQSTYGVTVTGLPTFNPVTTNTTTSTTGTGGTLANPCYVFKNVLQVGSTGPDVVALTTALKREGFLAQVTSVFDTTVMTGVKRLQEAHNTEILTPVGLTIGTGVVGAKTMAYLNSICVIVSTNTTTTTQSGTPVGTSCPARSGIQNGKYMYTFSKNSSGSWTVTLNNPAYGSVSDSYYVPAKYAITAIDKADLNRQNQGRFNYLITLPGTPEGNTEYANLFGSFNNAYYDWDNMTKTAGTNCQTTSTPTLIPAPVLPVSIDQVRYVKVSVADWDTLPLALREITVLGKNGVVLQPKVITATDYDGMYYLPGNLIDGNENTAWRAKKSTYTCATGSNPCEKVGDLQVITLDLGEVTTVDRIKVVNMGLTETRVFIIEISRDGNSYTQIAEARARIGLPILDSGVVWGIPIAATTVGPIQY